MDIYGGGSYEKLKAWVTSKIATHKSDASAHHSKYTDAEVDTIVAAHTAIASAHHTKYTDSEVDAIVAAHTAIASAHHTKYTDAEVDTIVAAHTAIASAHHTKYLDSEAVSAMGAKADANALHHDKYTDSEVDAILSVHTALSGAHHTKYTDAEAVAATEDQTYAFYVWRNATQNIPTTAWTVVEFETEVFDLGNVYNTTTHRFVAPVNGYYTFSANVIYSTINDNAKLIVSLVVNGTIRSMSRLTANGTDKQGSGCSLVYKLAANDYVEVKTYHTSGVTRPLYNGAGYNSFSGALLGKY